MISKFNEQLQSLRRAHKFTQQDVADKLHVSRQTVSSWETGRNMPNLEMTKQLADLYDVSTDYLLSFDASHKMHKKHSLVTAYQITFWVTVALLVSCRIAILNTKVGLLWIDILVVLAFALHFSLRLAANWTRRKLISVGHLFLGVISVLSIWLNIFPKGFEGFQINSFIFVSGIFLFVSGVLLWKIESQK